MRMKLRPVLAVLGLLLVLGGAALLLLRRPHHTPIGPAPAFTLPILHGIATAGLPELASPELSYVAGTGPYVFVFTDLKTDSMRAHLDSLAGDMARQAHVSLWNILENASQGAGLSYVVDSGGVHAERFMIDDGTVAKAYHAGPTACWIAVDRQGRIIWQGAANLEAFNSVLGEIK